LGQVEWTHALLTHLPGPLHKLQLPTSKFDGCGDKCFDTKIPTTDPMIFVSTFLCC